MHDQQGVVRRELAHHPAHLGQRQGRELRDAGVDEEALEAEDAAVVQRSQRAEVAGHRATPEADVDEALPLGDLTLQPQGRHVDGGRDRVQRHVDERGDAAGGGGAGGRGEPLPLGAAGLVDVHVGVDEPRQQHLVGRQLDDPGRLEAPADGGDDTVPDADVRSGLALRRDRPGRADDQVQLHQQKPGSECQAAPGSEASSRTTDASIRP